MATTYLYNKGFTIDGENKITYEAGNNIQFRLNYLLTKYRAVSWEFINSETKEVITTSTDKDPLVSFSFAHGTKGIDVKLTIDFGIHRTVFYKRRRVVIVPNTSTAVWTLSDLSSAPQYNGHTIVTAAALEHRIDGQYFAPGDIIHIAGNISSERIRWNNFNGAAGNPIIITTNNTTQRTITKSNTTEDDVMQIGDNCNHVWFYGKKDSNGVRSIKLINGGFSAQQFNGAANACNDVRIFGIEVYHAKSTGIKMKLDTVNRITGGFDDCWVYDCLVQKSGNEGFYEGYFKYDWDSTFNGGDYHHVMKRLKVFANEARECKWDGIQVSSCDEDTEVYYNVSINNATGNTSSQNFEMVMNGGFAGHFFGNVIINTVTKGGVQLLANKDSYVYNNFVYCPLAQNALFIRRTDNPDYSSPSGVYLHNDPYAFVYVFNNTFVSAQDSVYILDANDETTGIVPLSGLTYINNAVYYGGAAIEGQLRYNEPAGASQTIIINNYVSSTVAGLGVSYSTGSSTCDFNNDSIVPATEGVDLSAYIDVNNLLSQMFTDINDQYIPIRGKWHPGHSSRIGGHESINEPDVTKTQIQWYQTDDVTRVKIPEAYGSEFKSYALIDESNLNKKIASVKPIAKTGNKIGIEAFGTESIN
ncbi:hypothetical protein [Ohtaekwangia koreensis]|uniref:Right handed beta helix region n=1 Tax=Ohtaekwangia koreensis TaxID=688867 RepID=A0A1T5JQ40_9BACT|nr:hypothetical protein [Ohtaekwangia koreensis]SKC53413.1 hypothetical protein SAMN05660236_1339 [Ohtaekwangia koreensis]